MTKKQKLTNRKIISNNIFVLKMVHRAAPWYIPVYLGFNVLWAAANFLSSSYILRYVINGIQDGKTFSELVMAIILLLTAEVSIQISGIIWGYIVSPRADIKIRAYVNNIIYDKAASVDLSCFENPEFYDTYVKATGEGAGHVYDAIYTLGRVIWSAVSILANGFLIFAIDPILIIFAVVPLLMSLIVKKRRTWVYERQRKRKEIVRKRQYARRTFYLQDYAKEMRLFSIYKVMLRKFKEATDELNECAKQYGWKLALTEFARIFARSIVTVMGATFYAAYNTLVTKSISYGDCIVVINSISNISSVLENAASILLSFSENALYIEDFRDFLEYKIKIEENSNGLVSTGGDIRLNSVSFRYDGSDKDVLKNINITIGAKEKIAIVGHNGAGKSTLVKLLLRLYDPTEGSITYNGRDIKDYRLSSYRKDFGVVFQDFKQFSLSIKDNVLLRLGDNSDDERVTEALKKAGIYDKLSKLPDGINSVLTKEFDSDGVILSGGEHQKLCISRIFAQDFKFVLLDEPSSALDPVAEYEMYDSMLKACDDRAMVFISHRLSSAVLADRIYLMENGEVIESGSHDELINKNGKYAEMFKKQAQNYV